MPSPTRRLLLHALPPLLLAVILTGCGSLPPVTSTPSAPVLKKDSYVSLDQDEFPCQRWLPSGETKLVVIGFHGISGASDDMANLGLHLQAHLPGTAVYAPDLRGQGRDPREERRGDIRTPHDWYSDAYTLTALVRSEHPGAPVVWCGESMGSLIVLHAFANSPGTPPPCDALILVSPVSSLGREISAFRRVLLQVAATIAPRYHLTLEALAGVDQVQITRNEVHQSQAATNSWNVSSYTLRLLRTLGNMILRLSARAESVQVPTLILHAAHDVFSDPADVAKFAGCFPPEAAVQRHLYAESYHLLFYDTQRGKVLADLTRWLRSLDLHPPK